MPLTKEQLLQDRYKVIADYPCSPYNIGELIIFSHSRESFHLTTTWYYDEGEKMESDNYSNIKVLETYPHLFKKLEWWQERELDEMPEYLKVITRFGFPEDIGIIFPTSPGSYRPFIKYGFTTNQDGFVSGFDNIIIECFEPATKEEYQSYINQKQQ